ncbi:MAG: 4Fe-4S dicluster domain-containing protein [Desulfobacterales bacterium]|nr:4Fe-4S dicluster domain-containing protein [Desulfobacterales bacterium]
MKWAVEAETAIKKVPFFVRKRVRARVEKEAMQAGKKVVTLADVQATQARYLTSMSSEIKGYQVDACFGPGGCPNRANPGDRLMQKIEALLIAEDLLGFLKQHVQGDLKFHHEFRITFADCPNGCSQPQIKDIGILGACLPKISASPCTLCEACVDACAEGAIRLDSREEMPAIDFEKCLKCGQCVQVCPSGTIAEGEKGYRVQLGGKLGRHPKLAWELPGIFTEDEVLGIVKYCLDFYKKNSQQGERFAEIFQHGDFEQLSAGVQNYLNRPLRSSRKER